MPSRGIPPGAALCPGPLARPARAQPPADRGRSGPPPPVPGRAVPESDGRCSPAAWRPTPRPAPPEVPVPADSSPRTGRDMPDSSLTGSRSSCCPGRTRSPGHRSVRSDRRRKRPPSSRGCAAAESRPRARAPPVAPAQPPPASSRRPHCLAQRPGSRPALAMRPPRSVSARSH